MNGVCYINGSIGTFDDEPGPFVEFIDVVRQVEAYKNLSVLDVFITSPGGYVHVGDKIYKYLMALRSRGVVVNTHAAKICGSMATKIFMAGQKRAVSRDIDFIIHNPFGGHEGEADDIIKYGKELKRLQTDMCDFYVAGTGTSRDAIEPLMNDDTVLTAEQALDLGFATEISPPVALKPVARYRPSKSNLKTKNKKNMSKSKDNKKGWSKFFKRLEKKIDDAIGAKGMATIQDGTGTEIEFPDVEEGTNPVVGDKATVDGKPATGDHLMENGDTWVFADGKLSEIKKKDSEDDLSQEVEEKEKELETLKAKYKALKKSNKKKDLALVEVGKELKKTKKRVKSQFKHDPGSGNSNKGASRAKKGDRQVFAKTKD